MLNYDRSSQFQAKNEVPFYVNWFESGADNYKRGGTAPITENKRRPIAKNDGHLPSAGKDLPIKTIKNPDNVFKSMEVSQNNFHKKEEGGPSFKNSMQKISRIYNSSSGIPTKPKKVNQVDLKASLQGPSNSKHIPFLNSSSVMQGQSGTQGTRKLSATNKQIDFSTGSSLMGVIRRPQTSHKKGSSAYRRDRIFNETGDGFEDFQPNTGNIDLESLNNVLPDGSDNDADANPVFENLKHFDPLEKQGSKREKLQGLGDKPMRIKISSRNPGSHHVDGNKNSNEERLQTNPIEGKRSKAQFKEQGVQRKEDEDEDDNDSSYRKKDDKQKYSKARQILENRKYAEDYKNNIDVFDLDDFSDNDSANDDNTPIHKDKTDAKDDKENIVNMLGQNLKEHSEGLQLKTEDFNNGFDSSRPNENNQDEDQVFSQFSTFTRFQRPPTRKVQQAMNLDERFTAKGGQEQGDNNKVIIAPNKKQVRPPSRHRTPTRALGLDGQDDNAEGSKQNGRNGNKERGRQESKQRLGFWEDDDDEDQGEQMDFNNMLEIDDFLESDPRPQTRGDTDNTLRKPQTAQPQQTRIKDPNLADKIPNNFVKPNVTSYENKFIPFQRKNENEPKRSLLLSRGLKNRGKEAGKTNNPSNFNEEPFFPGPNHHNDNIQHHHNFNSIQNNKLLEQSDSRSNNDIHESIYDEESGEEEFEINRRKNKPSSNMGKIESTRAQTANNQKGGANHGDCFLKNNFFEGFTSSYRDEKSKIVFTHNRSTVHNPKKQTTDGNLPFETSLGKDFVGLFAN